MRDFKKAFLSTGAVVLIVIIISGIFLMVTSPFTHNYDWHLREQLSGTLDFLIVGASQGQCAFYTREIDRITGSSSYNLCYDASRNYEKHYLLSKELPRNNINTVVLELSYDTMQLPERNCYTSAYIFFTMRMDSFSDRMDYFIKNVDLDNKLYVYAEMMYSGLLELVNPQNYIDEKQFDLKGSRFIQGKNRCLRNEEILKKYNSKKFSASSFKESTVAGFTDLIKLCQDYGTRVIVAVAPVSDNYLWCTDNLDEFLKWAETYCADNNVEFYDFNLLKSRYELFSDIDCYGSDGHHTSEKGSRIFSAVFANLIQDVSRGQDISGRFYSSFEEMKKDSPYMAALNAE